MPRLVDPFRLIFGDTSGVTEFISFWSANFGSLVDCVLVTLLTGVVVVAEDALAAVRLRTDRVFVNLALCERAAGRRRRLCGVPASGVPLIGGIASMLAAHIDAERPLALGTCGWSSVIVYTDAVCYGPVGRRDASLNFA